MKKVCIIIRAYNRLEYTIQAISHIIRNTEYPNYEILVVNNGSQDGTEQWLNWVSQNSPFYSGKVRYAHLPQNKGDWGGLVHGATLTDAEYVMQVDNDILVPYMVEYFNVAEKPDISSFYLNPQYKWLNILVELIEKTNYRVVMCKRMGVKTSLDALSEAIYAKVSINKDCEANIKVYGISRPVACFITRRTELIEFAKKFPDITGTQTKFEFAKFVNKKVGKTDFITCLQMEGYTGRESDNYIQKKKYPQDNKNCWEFI